MTQADGQTPTAQEIRLQMRTLRPLIDAYLAAITLATRLTDDTRTERRFEVLANLSEAHAALSDELASSHESLGLPYERVLKASYTAIFGPDD